MPFIEFCCLLDLYLDTKNRIASVGREKTKAKSKSVIRYAHSDSYKNGVAFPAGQLNVWIDVRM